MGEKLFRGVSIKKILVDQIEQDIKHDKASLLYGKYRSIAEFVSEAIRVRLLLLNLQQVVPMKRCLTCIQTLPSDAPQVVPAE